MWWPGSKEASEAPAEGDDDETSEEIMEILSEEDAGAEGGGVSGDSGEAKEEDDEDDMELARLKDQFRQQEDLLGQLRGALRRNETKLQGKEQEVQVYASRLKQQTSAHAAPGEPSVPSGGSGKIRMLRRQLEEARMKEVEELDRIRDLELLVKDLQREVANRDEVITQMKEDQFSVASFQFSSPGSPFVMSPMTRSPNRSPPLGQSYDSAASMETYAAKGFAAKEEKILELMEKNLELEKQVLELEESGKAKDELIRARTEAVSLMSADLSARGKTTLDELEETKIQMREMQRNFADQEARWREEKQVMTVDLDGKAKRNEYLQSEANRAERIRFDLSTKVAALQEKVVNLQETLSRERKEKLSEVDSLTKERDEAQEERKCLSTNLKLALQDRHTQHDILLDEIAKSGGDKALASKVLDLENKLAESEAEKGNLQLKIVEWEEQAGSSWPPSQTVTSREELEETTKSLMETMAEKDQLEATFANLQDQLDEKSHQVSDLLSSNEELSRSKVTLEMRAVELEEQRDRWNEERADFQERIDRLNSRLQEQVRPTEELEAQLSVLRSEHSTLQDMHSEYERMYSQNERELLRKCETLEQNSVQIAELEKLLLAKNLEIAQGLSRCTDLETENRALEERIAQVERESMEREAERKKMTEEIQQLSSGEVVVSLNDEVQHLKSDVHGLEKQLEEKNIKIQELENVNGELFAAKMELETKAGDLEKLKDGWDQERESFLEKEEQLSEQTKLSMELHDKVAALNSECERLKDGQESDQSALESLREARASSEARSFELESRMETSVNELLEVKEKNSQLEHEVSCLESKLQEAHASSEARSLELESRMETSTNELLEAKEKNSQLENEVASLESKLQEALNSKAQVLEELSDAKSELTDARGAVEIMKAETDAIQIRLGNSETENKKNLSRVTELEGQLEIKAKELEEEKHIAIARQGDEADREEAILQLSEKMKVKETNLRIAQEESDALKRRLTELESQVTSKTRELIETAEGTESMKVEIENLQLKLHITEETCQGLNDKLNLALRDEEKLRFELRSRLEVAEATVEATHVEKEALLERIETLQSDAIQRKPPCSSQEEMSTQELEEEHLKLQREVADKSKEVAEHLERISVLADRSRQLESIVDDLRKQLEGSKDKLKVSESDKENLISELTSVRTAAEREKQNLVAEIQALSSRTTESDEDPKCGDGKTIGATESDKQMPQAATFSPESEEVPFEGFALGGEDEDDSGGWDVESVDIPALDDGSENHQEEIKAELKETSGDDGDGNAGWDVESVDFSDEGESRPDQASPDQQQPDNQETVECTPSQRLQVQPQPQELEADLEDGWGDDGWADDEVASLSENLRLTSESSGGAIGLSTDSNDVGDGLQMSEPKDETVVTPSNTPEGAEQPVEVPAQVADLQEEVKAQATKVAELLENYEKMSRQATEVMEEQAEWNEERKSLRQKMEDLSEEAEVNARERTELEAQLSRLQGERDELSGREIELLAQCRNLEVAAGKIPELEKKLQEAVAVESETESRMESLRNRAQELEMRLREAEDWVAAANKEKDIWIQVKTELLNRCEELEEKTDELQRSLVAREGDLAVTKAEFEVLQKREDDIQAAFAANQESARLEKEALSAKLQELPSPSVVAEQEQVIETLRESLHGLSEDAKSKSRRLSDVTHENKKLLISRETLESKAAELEVEMRSMVDEKEQLCQKMKMMESSLKEEVQNRETAENQASALEQELSVLREEISQRVAAEQLQKEALTTSRAEVLESELHAKSEDLRLSLVRIAELQDLLEARSSEICDLEGRLESRNSELQQRQSQCISLERSQEELSSNITELQRDLNAKIGEVQKESFTKIGHLEHQLDEKVSELEQCQLRYHGLEQWASNVQEEKEREFRSLRLESDKYEAELHAKQQEISDLSSTNKELVASRDSLQAHWDQLQAESQELRDKLQQMEREIQTHPQRIAELEERLSSALASLETATAQEEQLRAQVQSLEDAVAANNHQQQHEPRPPPDVTHSGAAGSQPDVAAPGYYHYYQQAATGGGGQPDLMPCSGESRALEVDLVQQHGEQPPQEQPLQEQHPQEQHPQEQHPQEQHPQEQHPQEQLPQEQPGLIPSFDLRGDQQLHPQQKDQGLLQGQQEVAESIFDPKPQEQEPVAPGIANYFAQQDAADAASIPAADFFATTAASPDPRNFYASLPSEQQVEEVDSTANFFNSPESTNPHFQPAAALFDSPQDQETPAGSFAAEEETRSSAMTSRHSETDLPAQEAVPEEPRAASTTDFFDRASPLPCATDDQRVQSSEHRPLNESSAALEMERCLQELEQYKQAIADWNVWAETQATERDALQQSLQEYMNAYQEVEGRLQEASTTREHMDNELAELFERLKTRDEEISQLNQQIEARQVSSSSTDTLTVRLEAKEAEVADMSQTIERLRDEKLEMQERLEELLNRVSLLPESSSVDEEELDSLQKRLNASEADAADLAVAVRKLDSEKEMLEKRLIQSSNEAEEAKKNLASEKDAIEKSLQEVTRDNESLRKQLGPLELETESLRKSHSQLEQDNGSLRESFNLLVEEKETLEHCAEESDRKVADLESERRDLEERVEILERTIDGYEKEASELNKALECLKEEKRKLEQDVLSIPEEVAKTFPDVQKVSELQGRIDSLEETLAEKEGLLTEASQGVETKVAEMLDLDRRWNEAYYAAIGEAGQGRQELEDKVRNMQETVDANDSEILDLKMNVSSLEEQNAELKESLAELSTAGGPPQELLDEINELTEKVSKLEALLKNSQEEVETIRSVAQLARTEKEALEEKFAELSNAFATQAQQAQDNKADAMLYREVKSKLVEVNIERTKLKMEVERLRQELDTAVASSGEASKDYADFQELNHNLQAEIRALKNHVQRQQEALYQQQQQVEGGGAPELQEIQRQLTIERQLVRQLEQDLQIKDEALRRAEDKLFYGKTNIESPSPTAGSATADTPETSMRSTSLEISQIFDSAVEVDNLASENDRLKQDLEKSVRENRHLTNQMESWKQQLTDLSLVEDDLVETESQEEDSSKEDNSSWRARRAQAWRSAGALQLRVEELTLEVTKLLEERDTLQLKLSNVMRQYERHKESSSRASTARSTPIPWVDNTAEIRELRAKIDELSRLNYSKDVELQKQRQQMESMQVKIRHHSSSSSTSSLMSPSMGRASPQRRTPSQGTESRPGPVLHL